MQHAECGQADVVPAAGRGNPYLRRTCGTTRQAVLQVWLPAPAWCEVQGVLPSVPPRRSCTIRTAILGNLHVCLPRALPQQTCWRRCSTRRRNCWQSSRTCTYECGTAGSAVDVSCFFSSSCTCSWVGRARTEHVALRGGAGHLAWADFLHCPVSACLLRRCWGLTSAGATMAPVACAACTSLA